MCAARPEKKTRNVRKTDPRESARSALRTWLAFTDVEMTLYGETARRAQELLQGLADELEALRQDEQYNHAKLAEVAVLNLSDRTIRIPGRPGCLRVQV